MRYYLHEGNLYQLQRCPFCGMDVADIYSTDDRAIEDGEEPTTPNRFTIVCNFNANGCGATCGYHDSIAQAVARWNTRVVI